MSGLPRTRRWGSLVTLALLLLAGCYATVGFPVDDDYYGAPPPALLATAPVYYYDGRPTYWYHGAWHYRDGGHWRHFRDEPHELRDFRSHIGRGGPTPAPMGRAAPMGRVGAPAPPLGRAPAPVPPAARGRATPRTWERPNRLHR